MKWKPELVLMILGIFGIFNSLTVLSRSSWNLGNIFPGLLGLVCIFTAVFLKKILLFFQTPLGHFFKIALLSGTVFFAATFLLSVYMIQRNIPQKPAPGADAVLVLGAGLKNGSEVSLTLGNRLDAAIGYYEENPDSLIVVSGGQGANELVTEAFAMKQYLEEHGVPPASVLMEEESTNTVENFALTKDLLDLHFGTEDYNIVYVTNDFHLYRSGMIASDTGFEAEGLPCPSYKPLLFQFYIREYFSLAKYYITKLFML